MGGLSPEPSPPLGCGSVCRRPFRVHTLHLLRVLYKLSLRKYKKPHKKANVLIIPLHLRKGGMFTVPDGEARSDPRKPPPPAPALLAMAQSSPFLKGLFTSGSDVASCRELPS